MLNATHAVAPRTQRELASRLVKSFLPKLYGAGSMLAGKLGIGSRRELVGLLGFGNGM